MRSTFRNHIPSLIRIRGSREVTAQALLRFDSVDAGDLYPPDRYPCERRNDTFEHHCYSMQFVNSERDYINFKCFLDVGDRHPVSFESVRHRRNVYADSSMGGS